MLIHQCRVPKASISQTPNYFNDLSIPDFQSITLLSVKTGERTADIHHTQLRQLNQHLTYKTLPYNEEEDSEDENTGTIWSFNNNNDSFINDNATQSSSIELLHGSNLSTNPAIKYTINNSQQIMKLS